MRKFVSIFGISIENALNMSTNMPQSVWSCGSWDIQYFCCFKIISSKHRFPYISNNQNVSIMFCLRKCKNHRPNLWLISLNLMYFPLIPHTTVIIAMSFLNDMAMNFDIKPHLRHLQLASARKELMVLRCEIRTDCKLR